MKIIKITDKLYPKRLKEIDNPPKQLYVLGDEKLLNRPSIAIVGTRRMDKYGEDQAKRFSTYLAEKGFTIVSGLARGIDTIAHIYSKDKKGRAIAVIASGFEHIYPKENIKLFEEILEQGGCIISEYSPETKIDLHRFPQRNRIISGIALGTLVVEADLRSGSMITANNTIKQRKELFCIPGNIDKKRSLGTNKLILQGANLVISPKDIEEYYKIEEEVKKVDLEYEKILEQIGTYPITANEIARNLKINIKEVQEALFILEIDEFIEAVVGGYILKGEN